MARVVIPVRVSESARDAIDAARGELSRSAWVEEAIAAKLDAESRRVSARGNSRQRTGGSGAPGRSLASDGAAQKCRHRNLRLAKGVCPDCKAYVASKTSPARKAAGRAPAEDCSGSAEQDSDSSN